MNITTTILTVGTALRHAQSHQAPVHVLCGTSWLTGSVIGLDGEGVALFTPDEETIVVRIAGISAVRIKSGVEGTFRHEPDRPAYDGLRFPTVDDIGDLGVAAVPSPKPKEEPAAARVSPYPVGHPARAGR